MNDSIKDQVIVVFGATGGIGSALVRQLARRGANLTLAARNAGRLNKLAEELKADAKEVDAASAEAVDQCLEDVEKQHGPLDGVVNCVGSLLLKPAHLTTDEDFASAITTNLTTSFNIVRSAAGRMMKNNGGSIVLTASAVALRGMINHEAIAAAKAGVVGLALSAAATYARYNVRVNCVAPGLTRTPLTKSLTTNEASLKASESLHPLGRVGEPDEIASAMAWFLDPQQSWVTGQVLAVDGGLSSIQPRMTSS